MSVKMQTVSISQLIVDGSDYPPGSGLKPRRDQNESFDSLVKLIAKDGMRTPIFVDASYQILSGHYRYWAAQEAKLTRVPVLIVRNEEQITDWFKKL